MTALLEIEALEAGYGAVQVLWGVTLRLAEPGIACLVGSNGAGKTTLMRTLSGQVRARAGHVRFQGASLDRMRPDQVLEAGIAHVPEGRRLFAGMSVEDNLLLGAYTARRIAVRGLERAYALFPRLRERRRQDASTLSGGEQQMCAIARGLMSEPKLSADRRAVARPGAAAGGRTGRRAWPTCPRAGPRCWSWNRTWRRRWTWRAKASSSIAARSS